MRRFKRVLLIAMMLMSFQVPAARAQLLIDLKIPQHHSFLSPFGIKLLEANYIYLCQYRNAASPANGAINNIYGSPTWVVPRENALAILGLLEVGRAYKMSSYINAAQLDRKSVV